MSKKLLALCLSVAMVIAAMSGIALLTGAEDPEVLPLEGGFGYAETQDGVPHTTDFDGKVAYQFGKGGTRRATVNNSMIARALGLEETADGHVVDMKIEAMIYWKQNANNGDRWFQFKTLKQDGSTVETANGNGVEELPQVAGVPGRWVVYTSERTDACIGKAGKDEVDVTTSLPNDSMYIAGMKYTVTLEDGTTKACQWGEVTYPDYSNLSLPEFSWRHDKTQSTQYDGRDVYSIAGGDFSYNQGRLAKWMGLTSNDVVDVTVSFSYFWAKGTDDGDPENGNPNDDLMRLETVGKDGNPTPDRGAVKLTDAGMKAGEWKTYTVTREEQILGVDGKDDWYLGFEIADGGAFYICGLSFSAKLADGSVRTASWGELVEDTTPDEPDPVDERYTLTGATTTIDLEDNTNGEIVEIDDQYAWKMGGKDNTWFGIGDADGILANSKKVTYEVEVMFDTTNLNDRFFFCFGDEEGWHGVNDKTEDPYFNGFAAHGNWKPTPKVGEWGVCTMTTDKFDPTKVDGGMIAKIGNWVVDGSLYIRSLKAYDTEDPTKVVSIEFAKKEAPAPENALTFAPSTDVVLNEDGAYVFPSEWKTLTLVNNTSVIAAGEKELTVEVQYTLDAPATADATFPNELFMIAKGEGSENESSYNPGTVEGAVRDGETLNSYTLKITANYGTDNLFFKYGNGTKLNLSYAKIYATDAPDQYLEFGEKKDNGDEPPVPEKMPILVVDDMDDAAKYGGNVTLDKTNKKQGAGAIMNSSANNWAGIQANDNSLNVDFSKLPENWLDTYYVEAWLYVSDVTAITPGSCLELSEVQDEIELQYALESLQGLTNGWNKIQIPVKNMGDSASQVKTIKKMRLFCVNLTKDLTVGLDDIVLTPYAGAANDSDYGKQQVADLAEAVAKAEKVDTKDVPKALTDALDAAIAAAKAVNGEEATVRDVMVLAETLAAAQKAVEDYEAPKPTETEPSATETEPSVTETEPSETETEPSATETEPSVTETEPSETETEPSEPEETEPSNEEPGETAAPTTEALPGETETGEASAVLPVALLAVAAAAVSAVALKKKEQK